MEDDRVEYSENTEGSDEESLREGQSLSVEEECSEWLIGGSGGSCLLL